MIPFIRSIPELMALTQSRANKQEIIANESQYNSGIDSGQRKRYIRSLSEKTIELPELRSREKRKWEKEKKAVSKFFNNLDYNNQIQASYDLTLLARQTKNDEINAA